MYLYHQLIRFFRRAIFLSLKEFGLGRHEISPASRSILISNLREYVSSEISEVKFRAYVTKELYKPKIKNTANNIEKSLNSLNELLSNPVFAEKFFNDISIQNLDLTTKGIFQLENYEDKSVHVYTDHETWEELNDIVDKEHGSSDKNIRETLNLLPPLEQYFLVRSILYAYKKQLDDISDKDLDSIKFDSNIKLEVNISMLIWSIYDELINVFPTKRALAKFLVALFSLCKFKNRLDMPIAYSYIDRILRNPSQRPK